MHQPYYKVPSSEYYLLPWVRLHGIKDYYGMAKVVERFERVKVTFNFSGVLLEALLDYVENKATDYYAYLSLKEPQYLSQEEKKFIIERFFSVNLERFVRPNKRFLQLYNKRLSFKKRFSAQDIQDLVALFNLAWFHPYSFKEDKNLVQILQKGRDYSRQDIEYLLNKQQKILEEIFPLYQRLLKEKRIELSLSPYYHPILPLVYDTDVLRELPHIKKPILRFSAPQDCLWHLRRAKEIFKKIFNYTPEGSWPSEGALSEEVLYLYRKEGFRWVATDEGILFKSLTSEYLSYEMIKNQRHILHRPYQFHNLNIFFRDRNLSDIISFVYQGWEDQRFAALDLLEHFRRTHLYVKDIFKERAITIIMDGENAWEYYKNNGVDFLETVYTHLAKSNFLGCTTPGEFLRCSPAKKLERLAPGSWINNDFGVWVGNKKNNQYWHILRRIKDALKKVKSQGLRKKIQDYLYVLEGSDWFWWNTFEDLSGEFKRIFFSYLQAVFKLLGKKPPRFN